MSTIDGYYLFASSTAGLVARTITHPNKQSLIKIVFPNLIGKHTSSTEKIQSLKSLYRGLPIALLFSVPAVSMYLSCYEATKQTLSTSYNIARDSSLNHLISGCAAEVSGCLFFTPMEVIKNRLQTQQKQARINSRSLIANIYKTEGIRGFYRGYWMGLVVFVPHSMTYFVTYEKLKQWILPNTDHNHPSLYMVCSSMAGVASVLVSTPLDIIKTRWQISAADHGKMYRDGPIAIAKNMLLNEGRGAFTRGLYARIAWGIPTTAISMTVFEVLKDSKEKLLKFL
ncbi:mitochondrial carrier domain-containing protein [Gilbertella persicaria]|uniref:mitochondrial carrier domain-containing protein n=1 Tax=Gilbertella persicaria TaxID=101096 RepID=UPI00221F5CFD|nr:mitochondrial carrier domain-containing protein [Gilbertella persicaria]KAI8084380.1 mitochondrial carrier domain-containing protein [Gilbertella persicaria]